MKNKFLLCSVLSLLMFSPAFAQESDNTIVPQSDIEIPAAEPKDETPTQDLSIPDLGQHSIQYDLNSLYTAETLPTNNTPLHMAHITKEEVIDWAMTSITDILTVGAGDLTKKLDDNKHKFTDEGFEDLIAFIRKNRITNANLIDNRDISVINAKKPAVVNEADIQGTYRWLINMPLIVSSADPATASSTNTVDARRKLMNEMAKNNKEYTLQVQIVRLGEDNGTPHQIAIEMIVEEQDRKKQ